MDSQIFKGWIARVKTHWIEKFLMTLKSSWNIDVWNGLAWPIWTPKMQVMAKKKGRESNWQFDSRPLKVKNHPNFVGFRWCATYHWKTLSRGYNIVLNLILIGGLHTKLWASKIMGVPTLGILKLPLGNPETKCHLHASPVANHKVYYKRESGGFPQSRTFIPQSVASQGTCPLILAFPLFSLQTHIWVHPGAWEHVSNHAFILCL
jgi:hypothetical protein